METYEEIQDTLLVDGDTLSFVFGDILAIKGSDTTLLHQEPSLSIVEQQEFNYYLSTKDCLDNSITTDTEFTITDGIYIYSFIVLRNPVQFTDGWSRLPVMLIGKTEL
jgi:hypothetical protein